MHAHEHAQPLEFIHETKLLEPLLRSRAGISARRFQTMELAPTLPPQPLHGSTGLRTVVAVLPEHHKAAEELVRRRYAWRGYGLSAAADDLGEARFLGDPGRRVTLLAVDDAKLLGTLTLRPDSSRGLLAEQTYKGDIDRLRGAGRKIGELVRLALEEGIDWKPALDVLAQSAYFVTRLLQALTDILIEVNPRHVRFYERIFGFVVAATGQLCSRVGAPSVLMRLDVEQFGRRLQRCSA